MNNEQLTINQETEWIEIGTIVAPQGLYGELRVYPDSDFPERFLVPGTRWLQHPDTGKIEAKELLGGRYLPGKKLYVIALEDVEYRDRAEALRDYKILVPKSDRPELQEDEFHVQDLINLEVFNQQTQENIGIVTNVFYAGNNLLEVTLHKQPEPEENQTPDLSKINRRSKRKKYKPKKPKLATILIPFVIEIVPIVDIKNNRIEIDPPEGLV
ncbi:Ribosome maturation factor RimM [Hyella patelloides LEGE 07179]|uniref:Ribosome maturation factor RimM n=1 Tax=Hyella patelloides LEGE 07179 TaxID=945734 RepID=A0A563VS18_9CYAN|nr:ribosome maturation factor RimM [Hyella patelloides]VEP14203.1 Ribosome maturation factor RimM [Hyella patelloides LEGE 07179]